MEQQGRVRLGGAWKVASERQAALEKTAQLLSGELESVRAVLKTSEDKRVGLEALVEQLRVRIALLTFQLAFAKGETRRAEQLRLGCEQKAEHTVRVARFENQKLRVAQQLALDTDRKYRSQRDANHELSCKLAAALQECKVMQAQYDAMEERAEKSEAFAKEKIAEAQMFKKAKEQKESYFSTLVKERDRVRQELVSVKSEFSKAKRSGQIKAAGGYQEENQDPNHQVAKLQAEEKQKLQVYCAPNRLKTQLAKEVALRKTMEQELEKLRRENQSLRVRYRNR